jgi:hypothetical protein
MMQHRLLDELDKVTARYRHLWFWQALAAAWLLAAIVGLAMLALRASLGLGSAALIPLLVVGALALAGGGIWLAVTAARNPLWTARQIEAAFPELRTCLLAAIEQRPDLPDGRFGYLQANVIHQALLHAQRQHWEEIVPARRIAWAMVANAASMALLVAVLFAIGFAAGRSPQIAALAGAGAAAAGSGQFSLTVEPGDTEIERGTSLLVLARVAGQVPAEATLVVAADGEDSRFPMSRSLNDPLFGKSIPSVSGPLVYRVEMAGQVSPEYHVTVFDYPRLERADAKLVYPKYTELAERLVQDVRTVSVVEGTELTLICRLNKLVASATLLEKEGPPIPLAIAPASDAPTYAAKILCDRTRKLTLDLVDEAGRKNVQPASFTINVTPNQPVALKPVFPARDLEASPLEEIEARATAWDDFGVARFGVSYALAGEEAVEVVLGEKAAARQKHELAHVVRLEELKAEPDELLSYYWWAEDFGPDGQPRRVESDMYFAEVRHFEEIFRQGEQPPGGQQQNQQQQQGQGQNAQQAQQLAQLQKEIINATWKVIRREIGQTLTDKFVPDVEQIVQSQEEALEQAAALAGRVQDAESQEHVAAVLQAMQEAVTHLKAAHDAPSREPLHPALAAEQASYQALLKLRAREHRVVRQQQQQQRGQQSSQARSQQQQRQLDQLDLNREQNPYETQRLAQEQQPETPEAREDRQVLNRLRELARRQHDLNERLKELQAALEEARTPEQEEEIRRQLKRLQDEQRQVVADTDELQSRMEQPENQERMTQERQQLEQAREDARRASEALDQENVSQAAATGTRAERQFEELRNEFRRRNANRFSEQMREMREAAQELDQREREVAERLEEQGVDAAAGENSRSSKSKSEKSQAPSLADGDARERAADEWAQQRQRLTNLQEQMRQTIDDANDTEPLLSERLYEAARGAQEQNLDRALQAAENSLRRGLPDIARQQEAAAGRGIRQLREGIEQAAEAVLGDETEALRRAREELENLSRELNDEVARNNPQGQQQPGERQPGERQPGEQQPGERQPGQQRQPDQQQQPGQRRQPGQQQPGEQRPGEQQPGEQQPGEQQPGERQPGERQPGQQQPGQQGQGQQPGQQQPGQQQGGRRGGQRRLSDSATRDDATRGDGNPDDPARREFAPLTGADFRDWSDRLRDVEEMVDDPELRAEAARIRERARNIRSEFKRHSAEPQWDLVQEHVLGPLIELRERVSDELLRRNARQAVVPLDRDPVPPKYSEKTRLYYERLGTGK